MANSLAPYRYDPVGFFQNHLGIEPHVGQRKFLSEGFTFNPDGLLTFKYVNLTASNRYGKTVILAGLHLWFACFKHNLLMKGKDWYDHDYGIINLCPLVDLANITRDMVDDILNNKAKEQIHNPNGRGFCDLGVLFERDKLSGGYLVSFGDYRGFKTKHTSVTMEYRTTSDNAKAVQGSPKYMITFDEAGRQKNFMNLMGAHVNPRTLDTGGAIITATTPDVDTATDYEDWWNLGDPENINRDPLFYSARGSIRQNPHVTEDMIRKMVAGTQEYLRDQVLEGRFVQAATAFFAKPSLDKAFRAEMKPSEQRERDHFYIIGADLAVAEAGDRSVFVVWDATTKPYRVMRVVEPLRGTPQPVLIERMKELLEYYNSEWRNLLTGNVDTCTGDLVYDSTGLGGKMFRDELMSLTPYPLGYDFGGTVKKKLNVLNSLRLTLDQGFLLIPGTYLGLKNELRNYELKDRKIQTDGVMALALAAHRAEMTQPVDLDRGEWRGVYS